MINILIYLKILLIYLFTNTNTPKGVLSTIVIFKDNFPGRKKSVWEYLLTTVINKNGFVVFAAVVCLFFILPVCAFAQEQTPSPGRKSIVIEHPAETLKDRLAREITIDIREMNAIDVLKFLALKGDFNVITSRQVAGRVTLYLKSVTIYDALEMVAISNNLAYHFENDIVHVMSAAEYEALFGKRFNDKTEVEIIKLDYARPSYVLAALDGIKSNWGRIIIDEDTGTVVIIDTAQSLKAMKSAIEEMESPLDVIVYPLQYAQAELVAMKFKARIDAHAVGSVTVDERTNKLIVRAFSGRREELEKLIKSLDTPTKEVLIEAKVMQVVFKPELDYGID
ncbi:MAG: hypothetical protein KAJ18_10290, partial [Candidatus Omnitrophica bacterium]|nr:hypothetical protein [Candidatus Omnitrophota bacterium]